MFDFCLPENVSLLHENNQFVTRVWGSHLYSENQMNSTGNPCRKSTLCLILQHVMLATEQSLPSKGERLACNRSCFQILFCLRFNGV